MDQKRHSGVRIGRIVRAAILLAAVAAVLLVLRATSQSEPLSLQSIQNSAARLKSFVDAFYWSAVAVFVIVYIVLTMWFPAAAVLTLLGGFLFGTVQAVISVASASLTAALITFWFSRYVAGDRIQRRWADPLRRLNRNLDRFGAEYLVIVRLIPMMPFMLVNILAGLTRVPAYTFAWTTLAGGLPGIILFSYFGRHLLDLQSVEEVVTWKSVTALSLMITGVVLVLVYHIVQVKKKHAPGMTAAGGGRKDNHVA